MEPSKEAIAVRITRINRQITGKFTSGSNKLNKRIDRETLLDAITVLYDECNDDPIKKNDEFVRAFVDKYRSSLADLRRARVCHSDFELLQVIGRGHFGEVHMVREKETSDVYALKILRKEEARKRVANGAEDERDVLANANGPWIPKLQYAFQDSSNLYLVMELCNGGDLAGLIARRNHPLTERDAAFYIAEVAHALKTLHGMGYVHRDIKPQNILLDRCGHVKIGDFGSCARLSDGSATGVAAGTPDYVAPELLAAADCAHTVCLDHCRPHAHTAISACDYWSLGVVAFELVTLKRPFSSGDDDSLPEILANIQRYGSKKNAEPPFEEFPQGPSAAWRSLVGGLLRVAPAKRFSYLDTLQQPALAHLRLHSIRDQAPPWVPHLRGPEDASYFNPPPRTPPPPSAVPFRSRPPFAGQLPFVGYSFVACNNHDDSSGGFNASHDCTAIDLATFKSAEKLAVMRGREIASLQGRLAEAEAAAAAAGERARRDADAEAERTRAKLQAEITALSLQNKRLERQVEVEKEERMALQRTNQELSSGIIERSNSELRATQTRLLELQAERDSIKEELNRLQMKYSELHAENTRNNSAMEAARAQEKHYKDIIHEARELRHRRLTEINVRAIDTIAKERALRRQTLSGGEAEGARLAAAEAGAAKEARLRARAEAKLAAADAETDSLRAELDVVRTQLATAQETLSARRRNSSAATHQLNEVQQQLEEQRAQNKALLIQVQELERSVQEAARREASLEEQSARTEARLREKLEEAETRATAALQDESRRREKVNGLEQLVRQLEREVSALEKRSCATCADREREQEREHEHADVESERARDCRSDTESVADGHAHSHAQLTVLREQLERAEAQLQARADEIATLRQETRAANLAKWRKEREYNELSVESKSTARELKRLEERLTLAQEARKTSEQKAATLQTELTTLRPQHQRAIADLDNLRQQLTKLKQEHEVVQTEVDRSRNDIRKLKSELQYSEKRRMHAEEQEELSSRERAQLRDELTALRTHNNDLMTNNKALQEACTLLEDQLTELEKLTDLHEVKNKDLESETQRMRSELEACRARLETAERAAAERAAAAGLAAQRGDEARDQARHANTQLQLLRERLESREARVAELESRLAALEGERSAAAAALGSAARRVRDLQEESAALRTRAHHHHAHALQLQASLADAQEEAAAAREASEAASAWWRTRETKADATIRQQAKLIDFLQAKVEEANRKKCSLSNKLFGRSGRRAAASPPLMRVNRELREEVERLRAKLAANDIPPTPKREKAFEKPKKLVNGIGSMDLLEDVLEPSLLIVWSDGNRERMNARCEEAALVLTRGDRELRARMLSPEATNLPHNEANRAFLIKVEEVGGGEGGSEAVAVCSSAGERAEWVSRLRAPPAGYRALALCDMRAPPHTALYVAPHAIAIGGPEGLHSLRGEVRIEWEGCVSPARACGAVRCAAACGGRALVVCGALLAHGGLLALGSALRRAPSLRPTFSLTRVRLPDVITPHILKVNAEESGEGPCAVVACGRRVFVLRFDAANTEFKIARSLTIDRPPSALLLTARHLFLAGEKPLKVNLPAGALETFAMEDATVAAAARAHSAPRALVLVRAKPLELLICYAECGVFVDEMGRRTRHEDPKWSAAVHSWEFVAPFLYAVGSDRVTVIYLSEEAYRAPPCTCDSSSLASSVSECYLPEVFNYKVREPVLLGTAPNGIIIRSTIDDGYSVSIIDGLSAFRSIGASLESLETISDSKGSSSDLTVSCTDLSQHEMSNESVEVNTGFLADIRKRAKQLRNAKRKETDKTSDDVIKEILTTEVGLKRVSGGRKSPAATSEFDSDTETDNEPSSAKGTADLCAEMFARQVRFK
ncbi:PREDICTED: citron Rho-interacting kinase isoform X1 [Papilio xuthus]|uniref:Citron Rho-interacting kinase isoform X1 n=1 Tax=Papilio xuthus TaxID=66420 RepID=A0AAJ7E9A9_PAPXU|nr:PREDICTED: citron Rho-interacting kinase isoform X1 [Papilio xuthus]